MYQEHTLNPTDTLIRNAIEQQHIPGIALGIYQDNRPLYTAYMGCANLEHGIAVSAQTVFEIASVTKLFTTQAVLYLAQMGQLDLHQPLSDSLPDLPEAWRVVTPYHCLTHQSGLPSYTEMDAYWQITRRDKTHGEVIDLVRDLPLRFAPGERYSYDNTGFYLLGMLIETVTGEAYTDFLKRIIFEPLGMTHTRGNDYAAIIPQRAQGYHYENGQLRNKAFYSTSNTFSAGVLVSTVQDLLTWSTSLFDDRILNAEMRERWWTPHPSKANNESVIQLQLGLGWFLVESQLGQFWGHNGGIAGFSSSLIYLPQQRMMTVLLCNAGHVSAPHEIGLAVVESLLKTNRYTP